MKTFPPTIILRHRKENLKKCSLHGLEEREDLIFYKYPWDEPLPSLEVYVILALDGPVLSEADNDMGLFLIDGTWRYAEKMFKSIEGPFETRRLPRTHTAYPRKQEDCPDPRQGLASVEALYLAYQILGRETAGLLEHYRWRDEFLNLNIE